VQIVLGIDDKFVILACDGLWDVLTSQAAVHFVSSRLGECQQQQSLDQIAEELALHAINVSAA
jgi:protein phosphatase 1G